jgi:hypothetical protein
MNPLSDATHVPAAATIATALGAIVLGFAVGAAHFASLRWNAALFTQGHPWRAFALQMLRLAASGLLFFLLARCGAWPLLCAAIAWLGARTFALRRAGGSR